MNTGPEPLMIPYPGDHGSGHAAGSATSKERQEDNDANGVTSAVQQLALRTIGMLKSEGLTAAEFEDMHGIGHGMASSALSHLHRAGRIRRVKMRRKRHEIYVLPEFVNGREESPYRPRLKPAHSLAVLNAVKLALGKAADARAGGSNDEEIGALWECAEMLAALTGVPVPEAQ